ncbi:hypothetical protein PoB_004385700 [Plakobranchus ocellatus]|uniref:Uncharacterized protein n=1 Tax=Plakobranchus ocellatus TaxID=259542 RepID=A0AAV4BDT6_9GAST|nr:hypothetical protein PoB_004385700 [Plakobranchus ocellatus]
MTSSQMNAQEFSVESTVLNLWFTQLSTEKGKWFPTTMCVLFQDDADGHIRCTACQSDWTVRARMDQHSCLCQGLLACKEGLGHFVGPIESLTRFGCVYDLVEGAQG